MSGTYKIDVNDVLEVHIEPPGDDLKVWVHTHGMEKFGHPELEVRDVPILFQAAAGSLLNRVAEYMLNHRRPVKLGHIYSENEFVVVYFMRLEPLEGHEDHFVVDRWALVHPEVAARKLGLVTCPRCSEKVSAYLLAEDGYEPGSGDLKVHLERLIQEGLLVRLPRPAGQRNDVFTPSPRGVAVYEQRCGGLECEWDQDEEED